MQQPQVENQTTVSPTNQADQDNSTPTSSTKKIILIILLVLFSVTVGYVLCKYTSPQTQSNVSSSPASSPEKPELKLPENYAEEHL